MSVGLLTLLPPVALIAVLTALAIPTPVAVFFASLLISQLAPSGIPGYFRHGHELALLFSTPALISIPIFVLAGELAGASGLTHRLFLFAGNLAETIVRKKPSNRSRLAVSLQAVLGLSFYAAVSGSGPSAVAAEGKRLATDLAQTGYASSRAAAVVAAVSGLCLVIPPSPALTLYAAASGTVTTLAFTASFVPGLLLAGVLFLVITLVNPARGENALNLPGRPAEAGAAGRATSARRMVHPREYPAAAFALALPLLLGIFFFSGFLLAPEGAAFACAYSLVYGYAAGTLNRATLRPLFIRVATAAGGILLMAALGALFNAMLREHQLQARFAALIIQESGRAGGLAVLVLIPLLVGCFMETPAVVTLAAPFLLPLAERCGIEVIRYGVIIAIASAAGLITPPYAANNFALAKTLGLGGQTTARNLFPYFLAYLGVIAGVVLVPELALWFPRLWGWRI